MIVVNDTSPLRGLLSIGKIELLKDLFEKVYIPTAVRNELRRISQVRLYIDSFLKHNWIEVCTVQNKKILAELSKHLGIFLLKQ